MLLGGGGCRVAWCCPWARMAGERSEGAEGGHVWGMWLIVHDYFYRIFCSMTALKVQLINLRANWYTIHEI